MDSSAAPKQPTGEVVAFPTKEASPQALLREAQQAWRAKLSAERTINRLKKYSGMSRSMKRDHSDAYGRMMRAEETLNRILNRL